MKCLNRQIFPLKNSKKINKTVQKYRKKYAGKDVPEVTDILVKQEDQKIEHRQNLSSLYKEYTNLELRRLNETKDLLTKATLAQVQMSNMIGETDNNVWIALMNIDPEKEFKSWKHNELKILQNEVEDQKDHVKDQEDQENDQTTPIPQQKKNTRG